MRESRKIAAPHVPAGRTSAGRASAGRATIADVAAAAGVSVATVDRVINARDPVRRQTAERVRQAAEALGFRAAPLIARRLTVERPAKTFGILLLRRQSGFYQDLAREIGRAAEASPRARLTTRVVYAENLSPTAVAAQIRALGAAVDALAVVSANHPAIAAAVEEVAGQGVPIFALISEITTAAPIGYIGLDNHALGRTAGWFIARAAKLPGKVAVLVGTHRFRCQDLNESGFRSYFREYGAGFTVIEPGATLENDEMAAELVRHLLRREPDLRGLYVAGGGIGGVVAALREAGGPGPLVVVGNDRPPEAHRGMLDGYVTLLLSHPLRPLCETLVRRMAQAALGEREAAGAEVLDLLIETPETLR